MSLSKHFTLGEMLVSETASRLDIDNSPSLDIVHNLTLLAAKMEEVRTLLGGWPITITSGYRCPELNEAIKGSKTSAHMKGFACDFICPKFGDPQAIVKEIAISGIEFDQVIEEFGRWVHFGISEAPRREVLTAKRIDGKTVYLPGVQ